MVSRQIKSLAPPALAIFVNVAQVAAGYLRIQAPTTLMQALELRDRI